MSWEQQCCWFVKLKVRSISTFQQNGPQNRWLRIILAYTSLYWIKISLQCIVYWGQHSLRRGKCLSSTNLIIFTGATHPTLRAKFIMLEWEKHHSHGAMDSGKFPYWTFTAKIPAFLPFFSTSFIHYHQRKTGLKSQFFFLNLCFVLCHWFLSSHTQILSQQFCLPSWNLGT